MSLTSGRNLSGSVHDTFFTQICDNVMGVLVKKEVATFRIKFDLPTRLCIVAFSMPKLSPSFSSVLRTPTSSRKPDIYVNESVEMTVPAKNPTADTIKSKEATTSKDGTKDDTKDKEKKKVLLEEDDEFEDFTVERMYFNLRE